MEQKAVFLAMMLKPFALLVGILFLYLIRVWMIKKFPEGKLKELLLKKV